jgi:hypothetical protein
VIVVVAVAVATAFTGVSLKFWARPHPTWTPPASPVAAPLPTATAREQRANILVEVQQRIDSGSLTLDGLGPLRIGMPLDQVRRALNDRGVGLREVSDTACRSRSPQSAPQGLSLLFQDGRLVRIDVAAPADTATRSGTRVGDPEARVRRLYPGRIKVLPNPSNKAGHYLLFTPRDRADTKLLLMFETDGRHVTSFRTGLREAVQLTRPCG